MQIRSLILLTVLFASSASAETTIAEYQKVDRKGGTWEFYASYVQGLGEGLSMSNVALRAEQKKPLFCVPDKLALSRYNYIQLLDDYLNSHVGKIDTDRQMVSVVMTWALMDAFPCK